MRSIRILGANHASQVLTAERELGKFEVQGANPW